MDARTGALEVRMKKVICILFSLSVLFVSAFADKNRFYEDGKVIDTMYVDSEDGLKVRDYPSLKSNRLCGLTHRFPVKIISVGKEETIDGITAPWIEILIPRYEWKSENPEYGWVFGGYLSKESPKINLNDERELKEYLVNNIWLIGIKYDEYAFLRFYENSSAEIITDYGGIYCKFDYSVLNDCRVSISNPSLTLIRYSPKDGDDTSPDTEEDIQSRSLYAGVYDISFTEYGFESDRGALRSHSFSNIWGDNWDLIIKTNELYKSNYFGMSSLDYYLSIMLENIKYRIMKKEKPSDEDIRIINMLIKSGVPTKNQEYEKQYHDYWNSIMEEHQKKADAMK